MPFTGEDRRERRDALGLRICSASVSDGWLTSGPAASSHNPSLLTPFSREATPPDPNEAQMDGSGSVSRGGGGA